MPGRTRIRTGLALVEQRPGDQSPEVARGSDDEDHAVSFGSWRSRDRARSKRRRRRPSLSLDPADVGCKHPEACQSHLVRVTIAGVTPTGGRLPHRVAMAVGSAAAGLGGRPRCPSRCRAASGVRLVHGPRRPHRVGVRRWGRGCGRSAGAALADGSGRNRLAGRVHCAGPVVAASGPAPGGTDGVPGREPSSLAGGGQRGGRRTRHPGSPLADRRRRGVRRLRRAVGRPASSGWRDQGLSDCCAGSAVGRACSCLAVGPRSLRRGQSPPDGYQAERDIDVTHLDDFIALVAARALLEERGFDVGMGEIGRGAGISRQAVYLHFESKADLLKQLTAWVEEQANLAALLAPVHDAPTGSRRCEPSSTRGPSSNPRFTPWPGLPSRPATATPRRRPSRPAGWPAGSPG